jgi:hypothetical protein
VVAVVVVATVVAVGTSVEVDADPHEVRTAVRRTKVARLAWARILTG